MKRFLTLFILVFLVFTQDAAQAEPMAFPLVCEAGQTCFITGYPDVSETPGLAEDYACGPATKDGDPFLHIGLAEVSLIPMGIYVVAAAAGTVREASDGYPDLVASSRAQIKKGTPVCGNGVVIDHGHDLTTAYCHLKRGSVTVKKGDTVTKGQVIGYAGQSGVALWPQLGFSINKNGFTIDPITNSSPAEGCGFKPRNFVALPENFKTYQPAAIVSLGFADTPQKAFDIEVGKATRMMQIDPSTPNLTFWGLVLGLRKGDQVDVRIVNPKGWEIHSMNIVMDQDKDRQLINLSRPRGFAYWREGQYGGEVKITREVKGKPYTIRRSVNVLIQENTN